MLFLSREVGQRIRIGDTAVIMVLGVRGEQVRLGIEAPASVPIWRGELLAPDFGKDLRNPLQRLSTRLS